MVYLVFFEEGQESDVGGHLSHVLVPVPRQHINGGLCNSQSQKLGRGIDSRNRFWNWVADLHRLLGRYDGPRFLAPLVLYIAVLKLPVPSANVVVPDMHGSPHLYWSDESGYALGSGSWSTRAKWATKIEKKKKFHVLKCRLSSQVFCNRSREAKIQIF